MQPVRWGVLGAAKIARSAVIPAIQAGPRARLLALASTDGERAQSLAQAAAIERVYGGPDAYAQMLADPDIEAVYVPSVTGLHAEHARLALAAGKAVLCEKPLVCRAREVLELQEFAQARGRQLREALMVAFHPQWQRVRDCIASGALGELRVVEGAFTYFNVDPANFRNQVAAGGGAMLDIGVYPLSTTRLATGREPLWVRADVSRDATFGTDVLVHAEVGFDGFQLRFYVSTQMAHFQAMRFHGSRGVLTVPAPFNPPSLASIELALDRQAQTIEILAACDQYQRMVDAFCAELRGERGAYRYDLDLSYRNQLAVDAVLASAGNRVELMS